MKRKLLFITLLMLFCSTMFGQGPEWQAPTQGTYEDYMSFTAMIQIDGANPNRSDLKIAAFNNGIVRGVGTSQIWNSDVTIVMFKIYGDKNDVLNFKLYVPGDNPEDDRILDTDFTIKLDPDYTGTSNVLNFYKKHFVVDNEYDLSMTVGATVRIDGVDPKRTDLDLAAFCGDEVRGVAKAIYWQSQDMYYYELIVGGRIDGEEITYKLYDPIADVDLLTDYKTTFKDGSTIDDGYGKPVTIEFKNNPVAMITNATGNHYFSTLEAAVAAAQPGETILLLQDVTLEGTLTIEKSITIDGDGFEIKPADATKTYNSAIMVGNSGWGDDHGGVITLNNIKLNNWKTNYGVVRAQGVTLNMTACEFNGNEVTDVADGAYGVLSLNFTDATVTNSIFKRNKDKAIDINYNGDDSNAEVTIEGCTFEENVSDGAGIVVRNDGTQLVVINSKFLNNTVTTSGNAAVLYAGWGTEDQITGCYFYGNNVTTSHATTKRFASAIFCDGCTVTGNAFEANTATRNGETITTTVAVGAFYGAANISENYWGGNAPVPGLNYTVEYTNNNVAVNDYYKEYTNGVLTDKVTLNNVAKAGKYYYESITAAFAAVQDGETVTMLHDVSLSESIKVNNNITLDLNGKTITGTDNATVSFALFEVQPSKELTVKDENNTGKITLTATNNRGWNAYSSVISNQRGKLTVNGGTIEHLGGTDMAYGIDNLTNGTIGEATTIINGGNIKSTYFAIRQFANSTSTLNKLVVTGGTIEYTWMQSPNNSVNTAAIEVREGSIAGMCISGANADLELSVLASALGEDGIYGSMPAGQTLDLTDGVYTLVKAVAQVGENKFGSVIKALNYAITNNAAQVEIVSDSRELMPTDVELILNDDLEITAAQPYTVQFYNNGTNYDFVVNSNNSNTLTFGENVTFQLEDRIIWLGYYGNNVYVVVNGTLAASQIWHGADTEVTLTGTIKSTGEAFVMRSGATLTVDGGTVNANYFSILAGNIDAENANITCGDMWIANTGSYANEGNVNINIKSSTLTSNGNLKSSTAHDDGVSINFENSEVTFTLHDGYGASEIDANTKLNVKGASANVSIKGLTNNGLVNVTEEAKLTLTGTITNNGAMKLDATSVIYAPENLGVTIDDNDYDVVYENGAYQAVHKPFVAEVDGTQFTSLQGAFEAVQDNGTITLLRDVTFDLTTVGYQDENWVDGVRYNGDKSFTVNFNTYKVTDNGCVNDYLININNKGEKDNEITFTNGTIESANGCWATVCVGAESSTHKTVLNLNDMNIINKNDASYSGNLAVRVRGTADVNTTVNVNNGTTITSDGASYGIAPSTNGAVVNINSGAIIEQKNSGTSGGNSVFAAVGGKGTVNIYDGAIIRSDSYGVHTMTTGTPVVNIYGGTITAEVALKASTNGGDGQSSTINVSGGMITGALEEYTDNAQIILTGGTFSTDVNDYCHEYYDAIQGDDNLWRVEQVLFAQTTELQAGWNWYSSYINLATPDGLEKIQTALGEEGIQIKGNYNNNSSTYENLGNGSYAWIGDFTPSAKQMYMINTSSAVTINVAGEMVDYKETPINLRSGWNWIGYPVSEAVDVNTALADLNGKVSGGDVIKTFGKSSQYSATSGKWVGQLTELKPGEGYMYKSSTSTSFVYSVGTGSKVENVDRTIEEKYWMSDVSEYANNMTVVAMLSIDGEIVKDNYEIAAFVNGECRGSERPIYVEELDAYVLFLTVHGDDVEELTFKYYDVNYGTEYELSNRINYSNDAVVGSIDEPYMFNLDILNIGETSVENISIYPNPTTTGSEINLQAVCDKVEVFNALGVKVAEYTNVDSIDAIETAGVYVIRLTIDNSARNCRLIVK